MSQAEEPNEPVNILLVDDRPDGRLTLEAVLNSPNYKLFTASSGIEAIKMAGLNDFAVILLDVQMPGMDGFETAEHIQSLDRAKDASIIFVTAINKETSQVYRGYETGAIDYVFKPFDPQILQAKVAILVSLYEKNRQIRHQSQLLIEAEHRARVRELAQMELENLKRVHKLADAIPHIVLKINVKGRVGYANKTWNDATGLSFDPDRELDWKSVFHTHELDLMLELWKIGEESSGTFETEARIAHRAKGTERWHLIRGIAERDIKGTVTGWILTCTDIQSRKEVEQILDRSNKELEQFAFAASHDLQEPLRKIISFGDLLKEQTSSLNGKALTYLGRIQDAAKRMSELVNNLLRYSRVNAMGQSTEIVDMEEVLQDVLSNLELQIKNCNARIEAPPLPSIVSNRSWMQQIFQNLIGNGLKFRRDEPPVIKISVKKRTNDWFFSIQDNGIGIEPEFHKEVFGIFRRLHSRDKYPGTGMGLAIVKKIIDGLGGDIRLESTVGQGTTFHVSIPILPVPQNIEQLTLI